MVQPEDSVRLIIRPFTYRTQFETPLKTAKPLRMTKAFRSFAETS